MSEHLLQECRPIAKALLTRHGLSVPSETCEMLANTIMHSRHSPRVGIDKARSPIPALKKAAKHARALLRYAKKPSSHKDSVQKRCASLRAALLSSGMLAFELGLAQVESEASGDLGLAQVESEASEYTMLLDSLEAGLPDISSLATLLESLNRIQSKPVDWQKVGRPWGLTRRVVRDSLIAWRSAGRTDSFTWNDDREVLLGPMPDFVRDLIACCNGTHELMVPHEHLHRPKPPKGYEFQWQKSVGDSLRLTNKALQMAIIDCKNEGLI